MKSTPPCAKVWYMIGKVKALDAKLGDELADAFCDFECAWHRHALEYHSETLVEPKKARCWLCLLQWVGLAVAIFAALMVMIRQTAYPG